MKTQMKSTIQRKFGLMKGAVSGYATKIYSYRHTYRNQRGFTLAETMMVFAVIFIASTGTLGIFSSALHTADTAKHITAATYTARAQMEAIKSTQFGYITAFFPQGVPSDVQGTSLPNGATWTVTYPDGTSARPLTISVTVSWPENSQTKSVQLTTQVTPP
jgi:type II secretory pathway pseudopilin PulG